MDAECTAHRENADAGLRVGHAQLLEIGRLKGKLAEAHAALKLVDDLLRQTIWRDHEDAAAARVIRQHTLLKPTTPPPPASRR